MDGMEMSTATNIRLRVEQGRHGLWYVTSPDNKGLIAVGATMHRALRSVHGALKQLDKAKRLSRKKVVKK
jgi:hypothetical protein